MSDNRIALINVNDISYVTETMSGDKISDKILISLSAGGDEYLTTTGKISEFCDLLAQIRKSGATVTEF